VNTKQLKNVLLATTLLSGCSVLTDRTAQATVEQMQRADLELDEKRGTTHATPMEALVEKAMYRPGRLLGEMGDNGTRDIYYSFDGPKSLLEHLYSRKSLDKDVTDEMKGTVVKSFRDIEAVGNVRFIEKAEGSQASLGYKGVHLDISLLDMSGEKGRLEGGISFRVNDEGRSFIQLSDIASEVSVKHEILHSMGFSHPHEEGSKIGVFAEMDSTRYTMLSNNNYTSPHYSDAGGVPLTADQEVAWNRVDYDKISIVKHPGYTDSLKVMDVYLLQEKYGASQKYTERWGQKFDSENLEAVLTNKTMHPFLDHNTEVLDALREEVNVTPEVRAQSSVERVLAERAAAPLGNGRG
jgi:hypothetical protein